MSVIAWTLVAFAAGSIPFSVLIARSVLRADLRTVGDGNPGATNVLRAGGIRWGILAFALDYLKGALPVGIAHFLAGIDGLALVPVAVAPVAGHAFSPWLGFRGGKAVAATFGVWSALTLGYIPTLLGLLLVLGYVVLDVDGWAVMFALGGVGLHLGVYQPDPALLATWAGITAILAWKHRADLAQSPGLNPALRRATHGNRS